MGFWCDVNKCNHFIGRLYGFEVCIRFIGIIEFIEAEFRNDGDIYIKYLTLPVPEPACSRRTLLTTRSWLRRDRVRGER